MVSPLIPLYQHPLTQMSQLDFPPLSLLKGLAISLSTQEVTANHEGLEQTSLTSENLEGFASGAISLVTLPSNSYLTSKFALRS